MEKQIVQDRETLEQLYGKPGQSALLKELNFIHPLYRPWIENAPFVVLATAGSAGLDVSPRGDQPGFIVIEDPYTLLLPDRRGNNRIDSLRNIIEDDRVALLFMVPGINEMLRLKGRAEIDVAPALLGCFACDGLLPRSVLRIHVESVYFQRSRAALRAGLWQANSQANPRDFPSPEVLLKTLSAQNEQATSSASRSGSGSER